MARPTSIDATDSEPFAYLRDPACGIPFDIHFEIEDTEGRSLGIVGAHKTVMALKSQVFKVMLFGSLPEGDLVKIKNTSMFAFNRMLGYMHHAQKDRRPWAIEIKDLFLMADLAERYNLPGLKQETLEYAKNYIFPKERLVEIFRLAEDYHVFPELSEAVLERCGQFLQAILETPEHLNNFAKEWSAKNSEGAAAALRLLARVDHRYMAYAYETPTAQKVFSHFWNIEVSIQPRHRLQQLKAMLEDGDTNTDELEWGINFDKVFACIDDFSSLKICQMKDKERAALEGVPLGLGTLVEDGFTHEMSVRLHMEMTSLSRFAWGAHAIDNIWKIMFEDEETKGIPGAQSIILSWFSANSEMIHITGKHRLAEKLRTCDDAVKDLPEYDGVVEMTRM